MSNKHAISVSSSGFPFPEREKNEERKNNKTRRDFFGSRITGKSASRCGRKKGEKRAEFKGFLGKGFETSSSSLRQKAPFDCKRSFFSHHLPTHTNSRRGRKGEGEKKSLEVSPPPTSHSCIAPSSFNLYPRKVLRYVKVFFALFLLWGKGNCHIHPSSLPPPPPVIWPTVRPTVRPRSPRFGRSIFAAIK